jgi:hypothetical protein
MDRGMVNRLLLQGQGEPLLHQGALSSKAKPIIGASARFNRTATLAGLNRRARKIFVSMEAPWSTT